MGTRTRYHLVTRLKPLEPFRRLQTIILSCLIIQVFDFRVLELDPGCNYIDKLAKKLAILDIPSCRKSAGKINKQKTIRPNICIYM